MFGQNERERQIGPVEKVLEIVEPIDDKFGDLFGEEVEKKSDQQENEKRVAETTDSVVGQRDEISNELETKVDIEQRIQIALEYIKTIHVLVIVGN